MRYFLRRIGFFIATLWAAVTLNSSFPGCSRETPPRSCSRSCRAVTPSSTSAKTEALRAMLGDPAGANLWDQYWNYLACWRAVTSASRTRTSPTR